MWGQPRVGDADPEALEQQDRLQVIQENHLCNRCDHDRVCAVSRTIHATLGDGAIVVSECDEFQQVELADDVA